MNIETARTALKTALTATGIERVYATEPDAVEEPCFVVGNPAGTYDDDFDGDITFTFPVVLLVSRAADSQHAVIAIDPFIDPTGSKSVRHALATVPQARLVGFTNYGAGYHVGDIEYAGVTFEVHVMSG